MIKNTEIRIFQILERESQIQIFIRLWMFLCPFSLTLISVQLTRLLLIIRTRKRKSKSKLNFSLAVLKTFDDQCMSNVFKAKLEESNNIKLFGDKRSDIINYSRYSRWEYIFEPDILCGIELHIWITRRSEIPLESALSACKIWSALAEDTSRVTRCTRVSYDIIRRRYAKREILGR